QTSRVVVSLGERRASHCFTPRRQIRITPGQDRGRCGGQRRDQGLNLHIVTGHVVCPTTVAQGWRHSAAYLGGEGTAAIQPTTWRRINRRRQFALEDEPWRGLTWICLWHGG